MKLLIQNSKVIGTAGDEYSGPEQTIDAPANFDIELAKMYSVVDGVLVFDVMEAITNATQKRLDDFAATRNYSVDSIAKYKDISDDEINTLPEQERLFVRKFRAECRYLALAVARTWAVLNIGLDEVRNGLRPMPTGYADIEPLLPQLKWPDE